MKTILLAVDGIAAHKNTVDYTLGLCSPVRAGLDILQIIRPRTYAAGLSKVKQRIFRARDYVEDALITAAFAEAGAPELADTLCATAQRRLKRLIPPDIVTEVTYHCVVTGEDPDFVLKRYVDERHHIIMAIYDSLRFWKKSTAKSGPHRKIGIGLLSKLSIPLVLVQDMLPGQDHQISRRQM